MQPGRVVCTLPLSSATHPKVARNLTRSFFDIAHKRCNSNDPISMFEIITRELRATLLRNHGTTTAGIWRVPGRVVCARSLSWGTHPKVARNLTRSFFDIAHKRCNSNDSISMFEIIARELRATLLRNYGTTGPRLQESGVCTTRAHARPRFLCALPFLDYSPKSRT